VRSTSSSLGDKAFDDDSLRAQLLELGHQHRFPARSNRKEPRAMHKGYYRKRYRVENFFARLKSRGTTATRRDKLAINFLSLVNFAALLEWLK
jgi:transposase